MSLISPASQALLNRYEAAKDEFAGADLPWLVTLRDESAEVFGASGLPTPQVEEWKYTNLNSIDKIELDGSVPQNVTPSDIPAKLGDGTRLVFVDGRYREDLSSSGSNLVGIRATHVGSLLASSKDLIHRPLAESGNDMPMMALNGAFQEDGYVLILESKTRIEELVEILYLNAGASVSYPRNIITLATGSKVRLIETHMGPHDTAQFFNGVTLITLEEGAEVTHFRHQIQGAGTVHVNTIKVEVAAGASYNSFILAEGGQMARDEIRVDLTDKGASAKLHGVYLGSGGQVIDNTTVISHQAPDTASEENYRGALKEKSRGVFQGNILVEKGADGADGRMSNKTLLLSENAEINSKPQLEIYADDVQCAHGSTTGELDEDALFYLRSRGIPETEAKAVLVEGFLTVVMDEFELGELNGPFRTRINNWMKSSKI